MACKYRIRSRAKSDLESIWLYTLEQWGVEQADTYIKALIQQFDWIADNPLLAKARDDIKAGYYCLPERMHLIFYKIINKKIEIIGIPHQSMDIIEYLK
jgi:toxin ParE1/3/4